MIGGMRVNQEKGVILNDDYSKFLSFDKKLRAVFRVFAWGSAIALCAILVIAVVNVCGEKLGRIGISWAAGIPNASGMIQYFHIPLVFLAAGYVTLDQGHTRIDLLIQKWPKVEKVAMFAGHILGAALSFFIAYRGLFVTLINQIQRHTRVSTNANAWPAWPFTICHCVGFFLLGCSFIWSMIRMVRFWKYPGVNAAVVMYPEEHLPPGEGPEGIQPEGEPSGKEDIK